MVNDEVQLHLKHLLSIGEGLRVEYKEAKKALPANMFETVCAMLNRDGGDILLGVDDNGQVIGVDVQYLGKLKTDIVNLSNNPQKLDPPFILFPVERSLEGKAIIHIPLPAIKDVAEKVHLETVNDFRVKFSENFRVKFNVKGNQLDRMTEMILRLSSGRLLVVKELAEEYSISVRTIHEDLRRLEEWNIVTFEGSPKTGTYILTEYGKALLEDVV